MNGQARSRCGTCQSPAVWTVQSRVPAKLTSRLGHKSFQSNCCGQHLEQTVTAALNAIQFSAPAKVSPAAA